MLLSHPTSNTTTVIDDDEDANSTVFSRLPADIDSIPHRCATTSFLSMVTRAGSGLLADQRTSAVD